MEALKTKEEAAAALKRFAHATAELGAVVALRDKAILAITEKHQTTISTLAGELTDIKSRLQAWAEGNGELFGEARSLEFGYGFVKFRKGQRQLVLLARWTWDKVLEKLQEFPVTSQWHEYIRNKPEINKRKLLEETKADGKMPEPKLRDIGLRVVREESFDIETKPEMVARDCDVMP